MKSDEIRGLNSLDRTLDKLRVNKFNLPFGSFRL